MSITFYTTHAIKTDRITCFHAAAHCLHFPAALYDVSPSEPAPPTTDPSKFCHFSAPPSRKAGQ